MPDHSRRASLLIPLLAAGALLGCGLDLQDGAQSLLKKAELLSVVLDPPTARPGQSVRASFLLADPRGPLRPLAVQWLPAALTEAEIGDGGPSPSWVATVERDLPRWALTGDDLRQETLLLRAPAAAGGPLSLSLLVQVTPRCVGSDNERGEEALLNHLYENMACGAVKLGRRTLLVTPDPPVEGNPRVLSIAVQQGEGPVRTARLVRPGDADLDGSRAAAMAGAVAIQGSSDVTFAAQAEAAPLSAAGDEQGAADLLYQWISTGGDFGGKRLASEAFEAPAYTEPAGERQDPNLYPVWLILRQGSLEPLGQTWAELYIRVLPPMPGGQRPR